MHVHRGEKGSAEFEIVPLGDFRHNQYAHLHGEGDD